MKRIDRGSPESGSKSRRKYLFERKLVFFYFSYIYVRECDSRYRGARTLSQHLDELLIVIGSLSWSKLHFDVLIQQLINKAVGRVRFLDLRLRNDFGTQSGGVQKFCTDGHEIFFLY